MERTVRELAAALHPTSMVPGQDVQYRQGVIDAVPSPQTVPPTVNIRIGGSAVVVVGVRYPRWYTPAVGDQVELLKAGPSVQVLSVLA